MADYGGREWVRLEERSITRPAQVTLHDLSSGVSDLASQRENEYASWWPCLVTKLQRRQHAREMHRLACRGGASGRGFRAPLVLAAANQLCPLEEEVVDRMKGLAAAAEWLLRGQVSRGVVGEIVEEVRRLGRLVDGAEVFDEGDEMWERIRRRRAGCCWEYLEDRAKDCYEEGKC